MPTSATTARSPADELVREVSAGRGSSVLIEGEPGIGKSALVRAAVTEVAEVGCQVFWGVGDELAQALLLLPVLDGLGVREPPRPQPPHRAPARRLAPRARMGQPVPRCHRPARHRGLTSPDPVTAPHGPQHPAPGIDTGQAARQRPAAKPRPQSAPRPAFPSQQRKSDHRHSSGGSRLRELLTHKNLNPR